MTNQIGQLACLITIRPIYELKLHATFEIWRRKTPLQTLLKFQILNTFYVIVLFKKKVMNF